MPASRPPEALPDWRSLLYVPVTNEKFVAGAATRGADAILLDLEDSIPPDDKARARAMVRAAVPRVAAGGADVLVRINRPWRLAIADIEASVDAGVKALAIPKVPDPGHLRAIAEILDEVEAERGLPPGHTGLLAVVETPAALLQAEAIARADPRVVGLSVGVEDLASAMAMVPDADSLYLPKMLGALAARAAGVQPFGYVGSVTDFSDVEAFRAIARRARRLGFVGAACIHPAQVAVLNAEFSPSPAEIADAEAMLAAFEAAGGAAARHRGRMIDLPVVDQARALLARRRG